MTVKFIVSGGQVIFGDRHYTRDFHAEIAERTGVPESSVAGGGLADLDSNRIFGTSYGFGPYSVEQLKQLLPSWEVESPSSY